MASQTQATINHDGNNVPAEGVYVPTTTANSFGAGQGVVNQLGGTAILDANNNYAAPPIIQLGDRTTPTQVAAVDTNGNLSITTGLPTQVQKANAVSTGSVATLAAAFTSNNTLGNSIIVMAGCGNGTAMTCADSAGNTYTSAIAAPNSTTFGVQIFYAVNVKAAGNTVTVTNAGTAASMGVQIYEVKGLIQQVLAELGQASKGTGTGTTATTSAIASSIPNAMAFMGVAVGTAAQAVSVTAATNWTLDSTQNSGGTPAGLFTFGALSQSLGPIAAVLPTATIAGSEPWAAAAAIFKPVALPIEGTVSIGGYNYTRVTTAATTLVKTGPGVLHAVVVNTPTSTGTLELDDALTNTTPIIGKMLFAASIAPFTAVYDVAFATGLSATVGVATIDATIVWK